jgi:hypothetical protein
VARWSQPLSLLILALVIAGAYLGNGTNLGTGDTRPARQLPISILSERDLDLDEFIDRYRPAHRHAVRFVNGHWVSDYPVGAALMAIPFYLPSVVLGVPPEREHLERLEKVAASGIVLLSALVMYATFRLATDHRAAILLTTIYALGTSSLSTSSQALWQHGPGQLAIASALYCLIRGSSSPRWMWLAGLPLAVAVLLRRRRCFPLFVAAALPVAAFWLWYNLTYFGSPFRTQFGFDNPALWTTPFWQGFAGLLFSPGRGLFVYSPIFLIAVAGFVKAWKARRSDDVGLAVLRYGSIGVAALVLIHSPWWSWWGGICYGPRLLADTIPVLSLALFPMVEVILARRRWQFVALFLALWSVTAHVSGAYWDDGRWSGYALPEGLWRWSDSPLVNPARSLLGTAAIAATGLSTSRSDPDLMAVSLVETPTQLPVVGLAGRQIRIDLEVTNDGDVVWLAWPKLEKGSVRLDWKLLRSDGASTRRRGGRIPLRHDVFPGGRYRFQIPIVLPTAPGAYDLRFDLVVNRGPRLSELGYGPLVVPIQVISGRLE